MTLNLSHIRADFPILGEVVHGKPLVYFDNAASTMKPRAVLDAERSFLEHDYSNIHRGVGLLSQRSTLAYEAARGEVATFLNARDHREITFLRGTTEAMNLIAATWGEVNIAAGDAIVTTVMEHHSNFLPWQQLAKKKGARFLVTPVTPDGQIDIAAFEKLLAEKPKLVALTHVSNALGTINPIKELISKAHAVGAIVVIDGAQAVAHLPVDVRDLDADFYAFSGHKVYGPTGIGVLYGRYDILKSMPPYQTGGGMIAAVSIDDAEWAPAPERFEAGTPAISQAIGLAAALRYVRQFSWGDIRTHETAMLTRATEALQKIDGLAIVGTAPEKVGVISFTLDGDIHPHDLGTILDQFGVAVRVGHHCTQPLMRSLGIAATTRVSFGLYNTIDEIDALIAGIAEAKRLFA